LLQKIFPNTSVFCEFRVLGYNILIFFIGKKLHGMNNFLKISVLCFIGYCWVINNNHFIALIKN